MRITIDHAAGARLVATLLAVALSCGVASSSEKGGAARSADEHRAARQAAHSSAARVPPADTSPTATTAPAANTPEAPQSAATLPAASAARPFPRELADLVGVLGPLDNFHVMTEGQAYRSATLAPTTLRTVLSRCGIRAVINLRGENRGTDWYDAERAICEELGVRLIDVRMSAKELPSCETLLQLHDAILATRDAPVLLHCKSGADRTGAAAALWRITVEGSTHADAANELSPFYGHFRFYHPLMDRLAGMYVPTRRWIEHEYPVP